MEYTYIQTCIYLFLPTLQFLEYIRSSGHVSGKGFPIETYTTSANKTASKHGATFQKKKPSGPTIIIPETNSFCTWQVAPSEKETIHEIMFCVSFREGTNSQA